MQLACTESQSKRSVWRAHVAATLSSERLGIAPKFAPSQKVRAGGLHCACEAISLTLLHKDRRSSA